MANIKTGYVKDKNGVIRKYTYSDSVGAHDITISGLGNIRRKADFIQSLREAGLSVLPKSQTQGLVAGGNGIYSMGGSGSAGGAGAGGGAGGKYGDLLDADLSAEYQKAMDAANAKNEQRYQEIDKGYGDRFDRNLAEIDKVGASERQAIGDRTKNEAGQVNSFLAGRGLLGTTVRPSLQGGVKRRADRSYGELADKLLQNKIRTDAALSGDRLAFQERREDVAPDFSQLIALQQAMGAGGYGYGGAGGGYAGAYGAFGGGSLGLNLGGDSDGSGGRLGRLQDRNARWNTMGLDGNYFDRQPYQVTPGMPSSPKPAASYLGQARPDYSSLAMGLTSQLGQGFLGNLTGGFTPRPGVSLTPANAPLNKYGNIAAMMP